MPGAAAGTARVLGSPGRSGDSPPPRRTRVVLPRFGRYAIARSAWAVMVKDGLTHRGAPGLPSVSNVDSSPIALLPLPDRQGSMWVSASGWKEDVIATPRE